MCFPPFTKIPNAPFFFLFPPHTHTHTQHTTHALIPPSPPTNQPPTPTHSPRSMTTPATLELVVQRLEAAAARLESIVKTTGGTGSAAAAPAAAALGGAAAGAGTATAPAVVAFDALLDTRLKPLLALADTIGGVVSEQAKLLQSALSKERGLIELAAASKKPDQAGLQTLLSPINDKNRGSPLFNHLSMVAEGVSALGWVAITAAPGLSPVSFVGEMKDSAQFYSQRVLKEYKDKDKTHVDYAQGFLAFLTDLQAYVKDKHTTGLTWNPRGGDATAYQSSAPAPAPAVSPAATASPAGGAAAAKASLFSALNKDGLTSALKKVDKSEMTHKNPELRASSVVPATAEKPASPAPKFGAAAAPKAPPKLELQGNKWIVENFANKTDIVLTDVEIRHTVYIYNCTGSAIQIKGKVNAVTIDNCKKTGVVVENVVATIDVVNCKSVQLQITDFAPIAVVDKTDGLQVYMSTKTAAAMEVFTAKSSEINVLVEGLGEDGGFAEKAVPEQFKSVIKDGKLITTVVEHSG
ncbi:adenylate cyclase associated N terminal-domain-containing protein [Zopfochytrium polystomum]|nr:adenylate cyclase associated N terminal-domain-containing protein [Zopfochytrium polystomum]